MQKLWHPLATLWLRVKAQLGLWWLVTFPAKCVTQQAAAPLFVCTCGLKARRLIGLSHSRCRKFFLLQLPWRFGVGWWDLSGRWSDLGLRVSFYRRRVWILRNRSKQLLLRTSVEIDTFGKNSSLLPKKATILLSCYCVWRLNHSESISRIL